MLNKNNQLCQQRKKGIKTIYKQGKYERQGNKKDKQNKTMG